MIYTMIVLGICVSDEVFQKKRIGEDNKVKPDHIFGYIGNTAAQAADHIHIPDGILSLSPAIPFFK